MNTLNYKFRNEKYFQTIGFQHAIVSVLDFKKGVISQGNYERDYEQLFDFAIVNQSTGEQYRDNNQLIPRQTFLVIHRIPATEQRAAKLWEPPRNPVVCLEFEENLEEDQWEDPTSLTVGEAKEVNGATIGEAKVMDVETKPDVPRRPNYVCHRCGEAGHWIRNCPTNSIKDFIPVIKRIHAGVPTKLSGVPVENPSEKPSRIIVNGKAILEEELPESKMGIPATFRCDICRSILRLATVVPCCKKPFCKECIMQRIWCGGNCPGCYGTVKAEKLQVDQPLQERVNAYCKQLKQLKQSKKRPKKIMNEYMQRKNVLSTPQVYKQRTAFTSFTHNKKPTVTISCLNCNEQGHVFKDCPKLELKDEPPNVPSFTKVTIPVDLTGSPPPVHFPTFPISWDKALKDVNSTRYLRYLERQHRRSRRKRRRSSSSSSSSSSRSRSRKKSRRRRKRSRAYLKSQRSRRSKSSRSGKSSIRSSVSREYSSNKRKRTRSRSKPSCRKNRGYRKDRLSSDSGVKMEESTTNLSNWPVVRKPPRPVKHERNHRGV